MRSRTSHFLTHLTGDSQENKISVDVVLSGALGTGEPRQGNVHVTVDGSSSIFFKGSSYVSRTSTGTTRHLGAAHWRADHTVISAEPAHTPLPYNVCVFVCL